MISFSMTDKIFNNVKAHAIEKGVWYGSNGKLVSWDYTFNGLGFKNYEYSGMTAYGQSVHCLDDAEYTWFMIQYS